MAEYIPFSFCKEIAAEYGIQGSFTEGKEATIVQGCNGPFSLSICYEETFGNLMREGRQNGSEMLVNLTSDYPS
jgi:apolipoprotein N-acyltransferase